MARLKGGYSHGRQPDPSDGGRELPDRRTDLRGLTAEGDEARLSRSVSQKLYRCPGCHGDLDIGSDHVVVVFTRRAGGSDHHHWHRRCATGILLPTLTRVREVPAERRRRR